MNTVLAKPNNGNVLLATWKVNVKDWINKKLYNTKGEHVGQIKIQPGRAVIRHKVCRIPLGKRFNWKERIQWTTGK